MASAPPLMTDDLIAHIHNCVERYFDEDYELVYWCHALDFGTPVVVVDAASGTDFRRVLGAVSADGSIWQQSSMSLKRPDKLVYFYEHLMSFALGLAKEPKSVLLLGLGGGTMARFLSRHYPGCSLTLVEKDPTIIDIAQRYFRVDMPVVAADARDFVAASSDVYDVILVDLYDGGGFVTADREFWRNCFRLLAPRGCLAINWADPTIFLQNKPIAAECASLSARSFSITPKSGDENLVQFCLRDPDFHIADLARHLREFEQPRRRRTNLGRCFVSEVSPEAPAGMVPAMLSGHELVREIDPVADTHE